MQDKNNTLRSLGWFVKNKSILKHMNQGNSKCFECYNDIIYENISYSRIIMNYNKDFVRNSSKKSGSFRSLDNLGNFEKYYRVICICNNCFDKNNEFKSAPRNYSDILADLFINERFDILKNDIDKIANNKLLELESKIKFMLYNYNEKILIYNALISENNRMKINLEMEIEKNKILSEQKSKNQALHKELNEYFLKSTKNLFNQYNKIIDDQVAKYNEINCAVKYNIPDLNNELKLD